MACRPPRGENRGVHTSEFDDLVRRHSGAVMAYARAMCRDRWQAEEAVQETFLRAWKYQDTFADRGSFEGWLIRICRNCVIDLAHRAARTEEIELVEVAIQPDHAGEVDDLLNRLPVAQREVVLLCGVLGYDYESAAVILDVPIGTVRSRLSRARQSLDASLRDAPAARPA
jgi:RNA polymerase sigma-70 factor (ECF subfamily)